jgi:hypothetical protein
MIYKKSIKQLILSIFKDTNTFLNIEMKDINVSLQTVGFVKGVPGVKFE